MKIMITAAALAVALVGCVSARAQTLLNSYTVTYCVSQTRLASMFRPNSIFDAYLAPGGWVHWMGDSRDKFLFDKCMNVYGLNPTGRAVSE
jgi:hypothetical protein